MQQYEEAGRWISVMIGHRCATLQSQLLLNFAAAVLSKLQAPGPLLPPQHCPGCCSSLSCDIYLGCDYFWVVRLRNNALGVQCWAQLQGGAVLNKSLPRSHDTVTSLVDVASDQIRERNCALSGGYMCSYDTNATRGPTQPSCCNSGKCLVECDTIVSKPYRAKEPFVCIK